MRTVNVPAQTVTEAIQSVEYNVGGYVRVVVGNGTMVDGTFQFIVPQQLQTYMIVDQPEFKDPQTGEIVRQQISDFTNLNNQHPNGSFSTDDLWPYIDLIRSRG